MICCTLSRDFDEDLHVFCLTWLPGLKGRQKLQTIAAFIDVNFVI